MAYDYIQLTPSGDVYAAEFDGQAIVRACGPLSYRDMPTDPADTDLGHDDADWLNGQEWRLLAGAELLQYLAGQYAPEPFGY